MLVVLALVCIALARCPQNCANHGTCVNNHCQCFDGYAGVDCSIQDTALVAGVTQSGTLAIRKWRYFHYDLLNAGQEATFVMHETNSGIGHDCDLYAQVNEYPTLRSYFAKDTSFGSNAVVRVNATAPRGTWYIGLFGFLGCSFQINVTVPQFACPNGCSGNGTCGNGGVCSCNTGFGGVDCATVNRTLVLDAASVTGHVQRRAWHYYYFDLQATKERILVRLSSPKDSDLYIRKNELPTLFRFDFVNASTPPSGQPDNASLLLQNPDLTRWYIGVYGWDETDYTLNATANVFGGTRCPNNCSLATHGNCVDGVCNCLPEYRGNVCEFMLSDMELGTTAFGYVDAGQWNYFTVSTSSALMLNVTAYMNTAITPGGDCDLYLKGDGYPNRTSFDSADLGVGSPMRVGMPASGAQRFYIGVFGWRACAFNITAIEQSAAVGCVHGHAENDECVCDTGYFGDECDVQPSALSSNAAPVNSTVVTGSWTYFVISASARSFTVTAQETQGNNGGFIELYAQIDGLPTDTDYWSRDITRNKMHYVHVELAASNATTVLVGVRGSGIGPEHGSTPFKISAFVSF